MSNAAPSLPLGREEFVGMLARAQALGVSNPQDLVATVLNRHAMDGGKTMSALLAMRPQRADRLASGNTGAFEALLASRNLTSADSVQMGLAAVNAIIANGGSVRENEAAIKQELRNKLADLNQEQVSEALRTGNITLQDLSSSQLNKFIDEYLDAQAITGLYERSFKRRAIRLGVGGLKRNAALRDDFGRFVDDRVQQVEILNPLQPIGDDQP